MICFYDVRIALKSILCLLLFIFFSLLIVNGTVYTGKWWLILNWTLSLSPLLWCAFNFCTRCHNGIAISTFYVRTQSIVLFRWRILYEINGNSKLSTGNQVSAFHFDVDLHLSFFSSLECFIHVIFIKLRTNSHKRFRLHARSVLRLETPLHSSRFISQCQYQAEWVSLSQFLQNVIKNQLYLVAQHAHGSILASKSNVIISNELPKHLSNKSSPCWLQSRFKKSIIMQWFKMPIDQLSSQWL